MHELNSCRGGRVACDSRCSHGAVRRPRRAASNNPNAPQGRGYNIYEMRSDSRLTKSHRKIHWRSLNPQTNHHQPVKSAFLLQKNLHVLKVKGHRIGPEELVPDHA
jgi:hypothetical protein